MEYTINSQNNKIVFTNYYSQGIIIIKDNQAEISMIKVSRNFRGLGYGKALMSALLHFIQEKLSNIYKIILSPLPTDSYGLTLKELIIFYSKFNFKQTPIPPQYAPYMMEKYF